MKKLLATIFLLCSVAQAAQENHNVVEVVITQGPSSGLSAIYNQMESYAAKQNIKLIPVYKPGASGQVGIAHATNRNSLVLTIKSDYERIEHIHKLNLVRTIVVPELVLVASNKSKISTADNIVDMEKQNPGKLNWGLVNNSLHQSTVDSFSDIYTLDKKKITRILYNTFSVSDIVAGTIDLVFLKTSIAHELSDAKLIKIVDIPPASRNKLQLEKNAVALYAPTTSTRKEWAKQFLDGFLNDNTANEFFNTANLKKL